MAAYGLYTHIASNKRRSILLLIGLFVVLKTEPLAVETSKIARQLTDQSTRLAVAADWGWLGFSYVAFRMLHVLFDKQNKLLAIGFIYDFPGAKQKNPFANPFERLSEFIADVKVLFAQRT